jgi:two-component system chemotaxis response regulator CheB
MHVPRIVVMGGSAGAISALGGVLSALPADFAAPVCAVLHIGGFASDLPNVVGKRSRLPVVFAADGMALEAGRVYLAPPDHHLVVEGSRANLSRGPRENFARPAIDPLFRSAAQTFGTSTIGVVLSGRLNDGTPGLYEIKARGGIAIVEDPETAEYPDMPRSALAHSPVDYCVPWEKIAPLLVSLTREDPRAASAEEISVMSEVATVSRPVALTCPECGGAMRHEQIGSFGQYVCHIGHRMTAETLADAQLANLDESVQTVLRKLNERAEICRAFSTEARSSGDMARRDRWETESAATQKQLAVLRQLLES